MKQIKTIECQGRQIKYELITKQVKNINLRIRSDCTISISANASVSQEVIDNFIQKKSEFIFTHLDNFKERQKYIPAPKEFVSGESFYLLGKSLRLKVVETKDEKVYSDGVFLYLQVKDKTDKLKKEKLITNFFNQQCTQQLTEIVNSIYPTFAKYKVDFPHLKFKTMKTRWGSCTPQKGIITLNKRLIQMPKNCIEYVVLHEFCHFIHPNHSKQFYAFVSMLMPDWKERKEILESMN